MWSISIDTRNQEKLSWKIFKKSGQKEANISVKVLWKGIFFGLNAYQYDFITKLNWWVEVLEDYIADISKSRNRDFCLGKNKKWVGYTWFLLPVRDLWIGVWQI